MVKKTYYEILEVDKKASQEDIKSAYRRLVMLYHPDKNKLPEAEEMFKVIARLIQYYQSEHSIHYFLRFMFSRRFCIACEREINTK